MNKIDERPGVMGVTTARIYARMKDGKPGDEITNEEMEQITLKAVKFSRSYIASAINKVRNEFGIQWARIRVDKVWRCLTEAEKVEYSASYTCRARSAARRGHKVAAVVDESKLEMPDRISHKLNILQQGLIINAGSKKMHDVLEQREIKNGNIAQPSVEQLVKLMADKEE